MRCTLVTTTWESIPYIEIFLTHYRALGVDRVLVMDFDSTDGTQDVLSARDWQGFVERVPFPGIALLDSSNDMLAMLRDAAGPDDWCLYCDPDELMVTPSMNIEDARGSSDELEVVSIPRFNVTAQLSIVRMAPHRLSATDALNLRIVRRASRAGAAEIPRETLTPPWIYTAIPGKVLARTREAIEVGAGDHSMRTTNGRSVTAPAGVYLLHYPFVTYEVFDDKIRRANLGFLANPQLSQGHGWQIRRWIRLAGEGKLRQEYEQQFVADADLERLLSEGALHIDESVVQFHQRIAADA